MGLREGRIYATKVWDLWDFQAKTVEAVSTIMPDMFQQTWPEFDYRLDILHVTNGAHVEVYGFFKLHLVCCVTDICQ